MLTVPLLILASLMGTGAIAGELDKPDMTIQLRTLNRSDARSPMQWEAVELLSEGALIETGALLDLDLLRWAPYCRSRLYTVFILTDKSDGLGRAIAVIARRDGNGWVVDQAFGRSSSVAPADLVQLASAICAKIDAGTAPYATDLSAAPSAPVRIPARTSAPSVAAPSAPALPAPAPEFDEVEPTVEDDALLVDDGTSSLLLDDETVTSPTDESFLDYGPEDGQAPTEDDGAGTLPF